MMVAQTQMLAVEVSWDGLVWLYFEESPGLSDAPDMGYEKNRTQNNANDFDLSSWKMELPSLTRKAVDVEGLGEMSSSVLNMQNLRCLLEIK